MAKKRAINSAAHDEVLQQLAKATQGITTAPLSGDIAHTTDALIRDSKAKGRKGARLSIAAAKHAIQTSPKSKQASLFDSLQHDQSLQRQIQKQGIDKIGAVLSATEHRAFKAVAILLSRHKVYEKTDNHFRQSGAFIPTSIEITLQEYYEAYGVKRIINNRNEADYQASEAQEALQALIGGYGSQKEKTEKRPSDGLVKPILQVYSRKAISGGKGLRDAIRTVEPFIRVKEVYRDLTKEQEQALKDGQEVTKKLKGLIITPSEIMLAMGHLYLPEAVYKAVEQKYSGPELSPTLYSLIMILALDVHHDKGKGEIKPFQRNLEKLAYNINKGQRIETRQKKRLKEELDKEAGKLRNVGAIKGEVKYTTGDGISGEQAEIDIVRAMFGTKDLPESEPLEELDQ